MHYIPITMIIITFIMFKYYETFLLSPPINICNIFSIIIIAVAIIVLMKNLVPHENWAIYTM